MAAVDAFLLQPLLLPIQSGRALDARDLAGLNCARRARQLKWQLRTPLWGFRVPSGPFFPVNSLFTPPVHVIDPSGVSMTTVSPAARLPFFV